VNGYALAHSVLNDSTGKRMKPKQAEIIRQSMTLFNREGYQSPSIDRVSENAGISKMTFYRYYTDKEALILDILQLKEREFMQALLDITADRSSPREKLFAVFEYYNTWFACEDFHGCMFTRALFEYGSSSSAIRRFVHSLNHVYTSFSARSSSRY
jgi:AcrR family transcriptional regulator